MIMIKIRTNAKPETIQIFLEKSLQTMDKRQIEAWIKYEYDPENMLTYIQDDQIVSILQIKPRKITLDQQEVQTSFISLAATLPDYRQRGYFKKLLEAYIDLSTNNELLSMAYTTFPRLLESHNYQQVLETRYISLTSKQCQTGNEKNIRHYNPYIDIYPLYEEFMSYFEGSIKLNREAFKKRMNYLTSIRNKTILCYDNEDKLVGLTIYSTHQKSAKIHCLMYLNSQAILDTLSYLALRFDTIHLIATANERLEKLFPFERSRKQGALMARIHNPKLFSKWFDSDIKNAIDVFESLEKPVWNHFDF